MSAPLRAAAFNRSLPRFGMSRDRAWSPPRGDDPDRLRPFHDDLFAFSISAPHPVAARLVVGPDDVRDVGVGNERYDAVTPSGSGIGSKVDGSHCILLSPKVSSPGERPWAPSRAAICAFGASV